MRYRRSPQEDANGLEPQQRNEFIQLRRQGGPAYGGIPSVPYQGEDSHVAPSNSYGKSTKGRVGPVYTFVKTDPEANFKWGVRHVVGSHYGR